MDRVFSVDDIADQFWPPHAPPTRLHEDGDVEQPSSSAAAASSSNVLGMNHSPSEWEFQMFLQDAVSPDHNSITQQSDGVVEIRENYHHCNDNQQRDIAAVAGGPSPNIPMDAEEYQAFLKSRLELECAAVALTRATNGKASKSAAAASDIGSQSSNSLQYKATGLDSSTVQNKDSGLPVGLPPIPSVTRKSGAQVKSTTSGSSGEQSDDDEAEGETETTQSMDPADAKRMRRYST
ncbi:hypothetical protein CDL12_18801 [Handroanthus impetiginosus]|uniref:Uncharacterized protein n=1 Tax=Handroanthus impetiginosus TaxID=429701 RepID=A0A2G9GTR4_9LAMI|nr:hypothetical protein CDL12_18801 [Handroanthus impetiginosus]